MLYNGSYKYCLATKCNSIGVYTYTYILRVHHVQSTLGPHCPIQNCQTSNYECVCVCGAGVGDGNCNDTVINAPIDVSHGTHMCVCVHTRYSYYAILTNKSAIELPTVLYMYTYIYIYIYIYYIRHTSVC